MENVTRQQVPNASCRQRFTTLVLRLLGKPPDVELVGCYVHDAGADPSQDGVVHVHPGGYILVGGLQSRYPAKVVVRDGMWIRALDEGGFLIEKAP